jgi:TctA family transporter
MNTTNTMNTTNKVDYDLVYLIFPLTNMFVKDYKECDEDYLTKKKENDTKKFLNLLITLFAMYLAWNCNKNVDSVLERVLYTLLAGLFGGLYLVYYLAKRIIYKNKNKNNSTTNTTHCKKKLYTSETSPLNTE